MDQSIQQTLQRAIAAHKDGRLAEAEADYLRILEEKPDDPNALNFLGMLRFHQGNQVEAERLLRRSVEVLPDNPHARVNLGNVLMVGDDYEGAHREFLRATELAPDLSIAWYNLGVCLRKLQRLHEAAAYLYKALQLDPTNTNAYEPLARLHMTIGRVQEAIDLYHRWLEVDPDSSIARHMLAALTGQDTPPRADDRYVKDVFNEFADTFDKTLAMLEYRAPQILADALSERLGPGAQRDMLDAGCGTGLCGPLLRPSARRLVGVDLSPKMLDKARVRGVYDELCEQELCAFMRSRPAEFDVVVSADTLVYFGQLGEAVWAARTCLREGGILAFTLERLDGQPAGTAFRLQHHGRYGHTEEYVRDVLAAAGFRDVRIGTDVLRYETGQKVHGHVVTAIRSASC